MSFWKTMFPPQMPQMPQTTQMRVPLYPGNWLAQGSGQRPADKEFWSDLHQEYEPRPVKNREEALERACYDWSGDIAGKGMTCTIEGEADGERVEFEFPVEEVALAQEVLGIGTPLKLVTLWDLRRLQSTAIEATDQVERLKEHVRSLELRNQNDGFSRYGGHQTQTNIHAELQQQISQAQTQPRLTPDKVKAIRDEFMRELYNKSPTVLMPPDLATGTSNQTRDEKFTWDSEREPGKKPDDD